MWIEGLRDLFIEILVADYHCVCIEADSLLDEEILRVVGGEELHLEKIGMLCYDIECLCPY